MNLPFGKLEFANSAEEDVLLVDNLPFGKLELHRVLSVGLKRKQIEGQTRAAQLQ